MTGLKNTQWDFSFLIALLGYTLLGFAFFDILDIFIPPSFFDPLWEFQAIGNVIERIPIPFLALALILAAEQNRRRLKLVSFLCIVFALLLFLSIPLGISDTLRINDQNSKQAGGQLEQQKNQLAQIKTRIISSTSVPDLDRLQKQLDPQSTKVNGNNIEEAKQQILAKVAKGEENLIEQAQIAQKKTRNALFKKSIKWNLGALIGGIVFIIAWLRTRALT